MLRILSKINFKKGRNRGFTLVELLVAMGISAIFAIVVIASYSISQKISRSSIIATATVSKAGSIQSYLKILVTNAGAVLFPRDAIRTYDSNTGGGDVNLYNLLSNNSNVPPPMNTGNKTDILAIAYGLPFTSPSMINYGRSGAQVKSATSNRITFYPNSPFNSIYDGGLANLYTGRIFMAYDFNKPSKVYVGVIRAFQKDTATNEITIAYSALSDNDPFTSVSDVSMLTVSSDNVKVVPVDIEAIYLSSDGNLVDAYWGVNGTLRTRILASGVEVFNIKYGVYTKATNTWNWKNFIDITSSDDIQKVRKVRFGIVLDNYYTIKRCYDIYNNPGNNQPPSPKNMTILGDQFEVHVAGAGSLDNPCGMLKVIQLEYPLKTLESFETNFLGG